MQFLAQGWEGHSWKLIILEPCSIYVNSSIISTNSLNPLKFLHFCSIFGMGGELFSYSNRGWLDFIGCQLVCLKRSSPLIVKPLSCVTIQRCIYHHETPQLYHMKKYAQSFLWKTECDSILNIHNSQIIFIVSYACSLVGLEGLLWISTLLQIWSKVLFFFCFPFFSLVGRVVF